MSAFARQRRLKVFAPGLASLGRALCKETSTHDEETIFVSLVLVIFPLFAVKLWGYLLKLK